MVGVVRAPNSARRICYFGTEQEKFAASSVLPDPSNFANWGNDSGPSPFRLSGWMRDAMTWSATCPLPTHRRLVRIESMVSYPSPSPNGHLGAMTRRWSLPHSQRRPIKPGRVVVVDAVQRRY